MAELVSKKLSKINNYSRRRVVKRSKGIATTSSSSKIGLAVASLVFLVVLVLTGKFIVWVGSLFKSGDNLSSISRNYSWDGSSSLNLAVQSDSVYILSFNPVDNKISLIKVPDQTYLEAPFGFGSWPIRSIYSLGQSENTPIGPLLLATTLSQNFRVPIDGYLISRQSLDKVAFPKFLDDSRKDPVGVITILKSFDTNLSPVEVMKFWLGVRGVRFDKIESVDLEQTSVTISKLLPDGSRSLSLDNTKLDSFIGSYFEDPKVSSEKLTIGIYNSTNKPGLAEEASRLVSNIGGRVVFTSNSDQPISKTVVVGGESYTKRRLAEIFAPNCLSQYSLFGLVKTNNPCIISDKSIDSSRSDIIIILGQDFHSLKLSL